MSTKAERGTKRTCRNPDCGARFYDLNRDPIVCPICQSVFELAAVPAALTAGGAQETARASARKVAPEPQEAVAGGEEDTLPAIEDDEEAAAGEEDETFLEAEEEDDGSDMSNIIGGPVAEADEPQ
jgi:uncharacterized protein (TIGR02300 family)